MCTPQAFSQTFKSRKWGLCRPQRTWNQNAEKQTSLFISQGPRPSVLVVASISTLLPATTPQFLILYSVCALCAYSSMALCHEHIMALAPTAVAAAKSLQSCPTLCNPIDGSPPNSSVPGILQARTPEWVAISFSLIPTTTWQLSMSHAQEEKADWLSWVLEQSHQVTSRGHARMAVFGPGIHLRVIHLYLSDLWLWCEDGVIGHTGAPLSEPVSSVGSYRACLLLLQLPESLFLQGCLEATGLSVYLPQHLSQRSTPLLVSFHRQQICCVSLTLFAVCLSFPVMRMLGLLIPAFEIW